MANPFDGTVYIVQVMRDGELFNVVPVWSRIDAEVLARIYLEDGYGASITVGNWETFLALRSSLS